MHNPQRQSAHTSGRLPILVILEVNVCGLGSEVVVASQRAVYPFVPPWGQSVSYLWPTDEVLHHWWVESLIQGHLLVH